MKMNVLRLNLEEHWTKDQFQGAEGASITTVITFTFDDDD